MNDIIDRAQAYVRDVFAGDFSGHDCFHTMRVFRLATAIAEAEGADMTIVQLAALLHDVDDRKLSPETCENKARAVAFMRACDLPEEAIARVCEIISEVSFAPRSRENACRTPTGWTPLAPSASRAHSPTVAMPIGRSTIRTRRPRCT